MTHVHHNNHNNGMIYSQLFKYWEIPFINVLDDECVCVRELELANWCKPAHTLREQSRAIIQ